jgi:hypothetical protein|tara:strand:+ start:804 stop:1022 length:219 start_codon:yes stop_codon:yes gene_type:complete
MSVNNYIKIYVVNTNKNMGSNYTLTAYTLQKFIGLLNSGKFKEIKFLNRFFLDKEKATILFNKLMKETDYAS